MRLIDADAMKKYCIEGLKDSEKELKIVGRYDLAKKMTEDICKDIDEQPTVDLVTHDAVVRWQALGEFREKINDYLLYSDEHGLVVTDDAINCVIDQINENR